MKHKRRLLDAGFYLTCFFLLAQAIYRLAFLVPPRPWEPGYMGFKIGSVCAAVLLSGMTVLFCIMAECNEEDKEEPEE